MDKSNLYYYIFNLHNLVHQAPLSGGYSYYYIHTRKKTHHTVALTSTNFECKQHEIFYPLLFLSTWFSYISFPLLHSFFLSHLSFPFFSSFLSHESLSIPLSISPDSQSLRPSINDYEFTLCETFPSILKFHHPFLADITLL